MPAHVIQIGRHRFACGLFWQSLSQPRELHKEAVALGRRLKFDLMVLRKDHGNAQAGYANTAEGVRPGMLSLGAAIARTVAAEGAHYDGRQQAVPNWLAALELPDGHWAYFAVRDENFLPTGDFAGRKEDVVERLTADYGLGGWNVVFGGEALRSIGFHNFHARTLDEFLPRGRGGAVRTDSSWTLESLNARRTRVLAATGTAAAAVALAGVYVAVDKQRRGESERQLQSVVDAARNIGQPVGPPPPHPWPSHALPAEFARECVQGLEHMAPGGWALDAYECSNTTATYSWKRGGASVVAHILELVPQATVALDGNSARHAQPLTAPASGRDEPLLPAKEILSTVTSALQALGLKLQLTHVPPPPPPRGLPSPSSPPPPGPPDWQTYRLSFKTGGLTPVLIAPVFDHPGVRLTKASFNGEDWSIEGVIYAK